ALVIANRAATMKGNTLPAFRVTICRVVVGVPSRPCQGGFFLVGHSFASSRYVLSCDREVLNQRADFVIGYAADTRHVDGDNFGEKPCDHPRAKGDRPRKHAVSDVSVDR